MSARAATASRLLRAAVVGGVVVGVVLRIALLRSRWAILESDEATVGLMARHILDGDFPTFYWGQQFGGAFESCLAAVVFAVTGGSSTGGLRAVPLGLSVAAAILVWRVGRRILGPVQGAAAALLLWVWPAPLVLWSIKERAFYWSTIVAGLAFVLAVLRLAERPNRRDALVAGLAAGIGWWSAPQIVVFVIPPVVWVVARHREALRPLLTFGLGAAVVGALPWLAYNLRHGLVSLHPPELEAVGQGTYVEHLETLGARGLPLILGLRVFLTEQWVPSGKALYLVALAALAFVVVVRRPPVLAIALVVFPFVHALSPLSGYVGEGRYLVYYVAFLALALVAVTDNRAVLVGLVVGLAATTVYSFDRLQPVPEFSAGNRPVPRDFGPLIDDLDRRGIRHVYANYWIAYRLAFESEERVVVGTMPAIVSRRPAWDRAVDRADRLGYVFPDDSNGVEAVRADLSRHGVSWQEHTAGGFRVIVPDRPFTSPEQVHP